MKNSHDLQFSETLSDSQTESNINGTAQLIMETKNIEKNRIINMVCHDLEVLCNELEDAERQEIKGTKLLPDMTRWNEALRQARKSIEAIIERYRGTFGLPKHEGECLGECPICELSKNLKSIKFDDKLNQNREK